MFKDFLKIIAIALIVFVVKGFVFAEDNEYKNSLLKIDLKKVQNGSFKVILQTQKPYQEPLNVIKRSDTEYVIILPETYSSNVVLPNTSDMSSEIADFDVSLFPYLSSSSNNGFTKITISTNSKIKLNPVFYSKEKQTEAMASAERIASVKEDKGKQQKIYTQSDFTTPEKKRIALNATNPLEKKTNLPKETMKKEQPKSLQQVVAPVEKSKNVEKTKSVVERVEQKTVTTELPLNVAPIEQVAQEPLIVELPQPPEQTVLPEKIEPITKTPNKPVFNISNKISMAKDHAKSSINGFIVGLKIKTIYLTQKLSENITGHSGVILLSFALILLIPLLVLAWLKRRLSSAEMQNIKIVSSKPEVISEPILTPTLSYKTQDQEKPIVAPTPAAIAKQGFTRSINEEERFDKFQIPEDRVNVFANPIKIFEKKQKPVKAEIEKPKVVVPVSKEPELISQFAIDEFAGFYFIRYEKHLALVGYVKDEIIVFKKLDDLYDVRFKVFKGHKAGNNQMYMVKAGKHFGLYRVEPENIKFVMDL